MTFPSLTDRPMAAFNDPRAASRTVERQKPEPENAAAQRDHARPEAPPPPAPSGAVRPTITLDLAALAVFRDADASAARPGLAAPEFLAAFALLLSSVSGGDVISARDAANILQLELFGGADDSAEEDREEALLRMLEDLVQLIRSARQGDLDAAGAAAALLARDMQSALFAPLAPIAPADRPAKRRRAARLAGYREPATLVQGATAAYERLMEPDAGASAA
jgi:hypothetical protein